MRKIIKTNDDNCFTFTCTRVLFIQPPANKSGATSRVSKRAAMYSLRSPLFYALPLFQPLRLIRCLLQCYDTTQRTTRPTLLLITTFISHTRNHSRQWIFCSCLFWHFLHCTFVFRTAAGQQITTHTHTHTHTHIYIQDVPGGMDKTSGQWTLCWTIPI